MSVYLVWSSQLGATEANVADATTLIPDRRARHFWDPDRLTGKVFAPIVGSEGPAWDVWMLFGPRARWTRDDAPTPSWWEHQLGGLPAGRRLNAGRFARKAAALEARAQARRSHGESRR